MHPFHSAVLTPRLVEEFQQRNRREREDPRAVFGEEAGWRGGELMRLMSLAPNEETFGSPAPTKRGEEEEVPDRRSPL